MPSETELLTQAKKLHGILKKSEDSEIFEIADELLLFLNRLQDIVQKSAASRIPSSSISEIIYRLESDPDSAMRDKDVMLRLQNILSILIKR
jgi:hypothetical protein